MGIKNFLNSWYEDAYLNQKIGWLNMLNNTSKVGCFVIPRGAPCTFQGQAIPDAEKLVIGNEWESLFRLPV